MTPSVRGREPTHTHSTHIRGHLPWPVFFFFLSSLLDPRKEEALCCYLGPASYDYSVGWTILFSRILSSFKRVIVCVIEQLDIDLRNQLIKITILKDLYLASSINIYADISCCEIFHLF